MTSRETQPILASDNPITSTREDTIGRSELAESLVDTILSYDTKKGIVVGLMGPWGSGKSSFIYLIGQTLKKKSINIIDFNPWLFSDTHQLAEYFFKEISTQLRLKGKKFERIAEGIERYSDVLSPISVIPFFGNWWDRVLKSGKTIGKFAKTKYGGIEKLRAEVTSALAKLDHPLVVVIDDIDRLSTKEIREVFKLVRLTANFPNIIYLLAFDRQRVEIALDESKVPGRLYIEKILQVVYDLPEIPKSVSREQIFQELDKIIRHIPESEFDQVRWPDVYFEILEPNIRNIRDIKRYALSANTVLRALKDSVDTVDVLALEAIRVFRPNLHSKLKQAVEVLTEKSDYHTEENTKNKNVIEDLMINEDVKYVHNVIERIFPAAQRYIGGTNYAYGYANEWRRNKRVAHEDNLRTYMEQRISEGSISMKKAKTAYELMANQNKFHEFMTSLDPVELEDIIQSLEVYEGEYGNEQVVPASIVLMNNIYRIPEKKNRGMFDVMRPDIVVGRVVLRMLRSIVDDNERAAMAQEILSQLDAYSTKLDFIELIGHREGMGHKLIGKDMAEQLVDDLLNQLLSKRPTNFKHEWQILRLYYFVANRRGENYVPFEISKPAEIRALLRDAYAENRSQSMGTRAVTATPGLHWDALIKVVGSEEKLKEIVNKLKKVDGQSDLINLVEKYLTGWRPKRNED